jgi:C-terminal processing protease CtpA/Prc
VIVFDYPHTTIDLRPGGDPSGNVVRDRSGLILMAKGDGVTVAQVLQGTPASEAGLTEGAQIVAIDGNAVTGADLAHIRTMLQGTPGTLLRVHLADGTTHDLSLRQYL